MAIHASNVLPKNRTLPPILILHVWVRICWWYLQAPKMFDCIHLRIIILMFIKGIATFTLSSFSSSMTSLISSSTCPILTFYTFPESSDQMLVNGEEKRSRFDGLHTIISDIHFVMEVFQRFKTQTECWPSKHIFIPSLNLFSLHQSPAFDLAIPERYKT